MKLTIGYITARLDPKFERFADSLDNELLATPTLARSDIEVRMVDFHGWYDKDRAEMFNALVRGRFPFFHHTPKPTVWQGPHRRTPVDFFAAANSRNTMFVYAKAPHIAFVDDLSVLLPGWLSAHLHAADYEYVLCGMTSKYREMIVKKGVIMAHTAHPPGSDSRIRQIYKDGAIPCSGAWLYGGTFSVPLEAALRVNGQDEQCDSIGGEDYDFGIRLERAGFPIRANRSCMTVEDEDLHHDGMPMFRLNKPVQEHGPYSSDKMLHELQTSTRSWTQGNSFSLRALRERVTQGGDLPSPDGPTRHWVDGQPLSEVHPMPDLDARLRSVIPKLEGWCSQEKASELAMLVATTSPSLCVEIGVFGGRSLAAMALACVRNGRGRVVGIDPWSKDRSLEHVQEQGNLDWWGKLDHERIYRGCVKMIEDEHLDGVCELRRMSASEAAPAFKEGSIDILHIDGNHSETQSVADVRNYLPKVKAGGYIWFDDIDWPSTAKALELLRAHAGLVKTVGTCALYRKKR